MKKVILLLLMMLLCLLLYSCAANHDVSIVVGSYTYTDGERYSAGGGHIGGRVSRVDVNWIEGAVEIAYHNGEDILLSESAKTPLTKSSELHWRLDGTTLYVKYAASDWHIQDGLDKRLTLLLPEGLRLDNARITVASADVQADGLNAATVYAMSSSGDVALQLSGESGEIQVDTASGDVRINAERADKMIINTTSGEVYTSVEQANELKVHAVSGDLSLAFAHAPEKIDVDSVSGSVTICLPAGVGLTAEVDSVSGDVSGSLPVESRGGGWYIGGDGRCSVRVNTISGDIRLDEWAGEENSGRED